MALGEGLVLVHEILHFWLFSHWRLLIVESVIIIFSRIAFFPQLLVRSGRRSSKRTGHFVPHTLILVVVAPPELIVDRIIVVTLLIKLHFFWRLLPWLFSLGLLVRIYFLQVYQRVRLSVLMLRLRFSLVVSVVEVRELERTPAPVLQFGPDFLVAKHELFSFFV